MKENRILFDNVVNGSTRGLRMDFSSSRNFVIICIGGALVVILAYVDIF